jgi:hypothetical protein
MADPVLCLLKTVVVVHAPSCRRIDKWLQILHSTPETHVRARKASSPVRIIYLLSDGGPRFVYDLIDESQFDLRLMGAVYQACRQTRVESEDARRIESGRTFEDLQHDARTKTWPVTDRWQRSDGAAGMTPGMSLRLEYL